MGGGGLGFGRMVRMSACKATVGICVGSNPLADTGLTKFDWKVVDQWATKDSNLVAQQ